MPTAREAIRSAINDLTLKGYVYKGKLPPPKGQTAGRLGGPRADAVSLHRGR